MKKVVIEDHLGICADLDKEMSYLVDTYKCEWKEVVEDPAKKQKFNYFVNTPDPDYSVTFSRKRGQKQPFSKQSKVPV